MDEATIHRAIMKLNPNNEYSGTSVNRLLDLLGPEGFDMSRITLKLNEMAMKGLIYEG
jgi:hypothetical protein